MSNICCTNCNLDLVENFSALDDYMLRRSLWERIHPRGYKGFLCWSCLTDLVQEHLHRTLNPQDFTICACFVNRHVHQLTAVEAFRHMRGIAHDAPIHPDTLSKLTKLEARQERWAASMWIDTAKLLTGWDEYPPSDNKSLGAHHDHSKHPHR